MTQMSGRAIVWIGKPFGLGAADLILRDPVIAIAKPAHCSNLQFFPVVVYVSLTISHRLSLSLRSIPTKPPRPTASPPPRWHVPIQTTNATANHANPVLSSRGRWGAG